MENLTRRKTNVRNRSDAAQLACRDPLIDETRIFERLRRILTRSGIPVPLRRILCTRVYKQMFHALAVQKGREH